MDDTESMLHTEEDAKAAVDRLLDMRAGPEWESVMLVMGGDVMQSLPIFGIKRTPATERLMAAHDKVHDWEARWGMFKTPGGQHTAALEFDFPAADCQLALFFPLPKELPTLDIIVTMEGNMGLAFTKDDYKKGTMVEVRGVPCDLPKSILKFRNKIK